MHQGRRVPPGRSLSDEKFAGLERPLLLLFSSPFSFVLFVPSFHGKRNANHEVNAFRTHPHRVRRGREVRPGPGRRVPRSACPCALVPQGESSRTLQGTPTGWFTPLNHVTLFVAQLTCVSGARGRRSLHNHRLQVQQPWPLLQDLDPRGSS